MEKNEPNYRLTINDQEYEINRRNGSIVKYLGAMAIHNHVTFELGGKVGHMFSEVPGYQEVLELMEKGEFPTLMNIPDVPENILEAHANCIIALEEQSLDEIPDDWEEA